MVALVLVAGLVNYVGYSRRASAEQQALDQVNHTKAEIANLDKVIGEVNDITKRKKELEEKLAVLTNLKRNRSGPVKLLDAVQTALPKKVWLMNMSEAGGAMAFAGTAFSHDDLAEFMSSLENVVNTPLGLGRTVEGGVAGKNSRVELSDGKVQEFPLADVHHFFNNIQLKGANETNNGSYKIVNFNLTCSANYSA